jgi:hypothetical protein
MKSILHTFFGLILVLSLAFFSQVYGQGVTTANINGNVNDVEGETLIGANVTAVHEPSGTTYGVVTDVDGNYRIANMRVGGPYTITITYVGYTNQSLTDIILRLGENRRFNFSMEQTALELMSVEVVARSGTSGRSSGTSTQITSSDIEKMPTLNRDITDFVRLTPQSTGYGGGTAFAGVNNRYNAIYIDGAVNNDVFGLASSGTNGGQTGISPFSIDIIDQFQVVLSPYDVTLGGFAGGGINAVTKSGTNEFKGTAYYFFQNDKLVGKTNSSITDRTGNEAVAVAPFSQNTFGASLGGPIVKDKVFFFLNTEIQRDETPTPFDFGTYEGDASQADLNALRDHLINSFDYDPGEYGDVVSGLDGLKIFGKLDFNLNNNNRLTLRHSYTKGESTSRYSSSSRTINFSNNGIYFPTTTNSTALELNSMFGNNMSNNLIVGYTRVRDNRRPLGNNFPYVFIDDGVGLIRFGSEEFSTANQLDQDIISVTNNFKLYRGNHTITLGTHNEFYSIYNVFIGQNFGTYRFASIDDFISGEPAFRYNRAYSLVDDIVGGGTAAAADFNAVQFGLYIQDEWAVNSQFTLTGGLRIDIPFITTEPAIHPTFATETLPDIVAQYPIAGDIEPGSAPDGQLMFSPRLGFEYDVTGDRKNVLRGGAGIFTSRIPFVWPGAMFNNNGLTIGQVNQNDIEGPVLFNPDINTQYVNENFEVPSGNVDIFTSDFKYPQVFRTNLGFDTELPGGINATFEGIYTKTLNNILYTNVNSSPEVKNTWTGGPDNRDVYVRQSIDPRYSAIYLGSNTSEGYTYNLTVALDKAFDFGLAASLAYTYGDATAVSEGTSSQNSSQWRGQIHVDGRNNPSFGRSDFALGHRVIAGLSYSFDWNEAKNASTTFSLFYDGQMGSPYSYIYGSSAANNIANETGSTSRARTLIWIPANESEINLIDVVNSDGEVTLTAEEQWANLNAFIEADPYLSANRGGYAEKNSNWLPFVSYLDFAVRQDVGINVGGRLHRLQFSWDVFNLANLINSSWGVRYGTPGDFNTFEVITFRGYEADGTTPRFNYTRGDVIETDAYPIADFSSRWRMRLGVRYIF